MHLLEVTRALLMPTKMFLEPHWGEAVLTAAHLINRITSQVLGFKNPINVFFQTFLISMFFANFFLRSLDVYHLYIYS